MRTTRQDRRILPALTFTAVLCLVAAGAATSALAANWGQGGYELTITEHFNASGEYHTGSVVMVLNHLDTETVTIQASATQAGEEVLTCTTSSDTLATYYKLTGNDLTGGGDGDWVGSSDFVSPARSYPVGGSGASEITLHVKGVADNWRANDAGEYQASITLTASW